MEMTEIGHGLGYMLGSVAGAYAAANFVIIPIAALLVQGTRWVINSTRWCINKFSTGV